MFGLLSLFGFCSARNVVAMESRRICDVDTCVCFCVTILRLDFGFESTHMYTNTPSISVSLQMLTIWCVDEWGSLAKARCCFAACNVGRVSETFCVIDYCLPFWLLIFFIAKIAWLESCRDGDCVALQTVWLITGEIEEAMRALPFGWIDRCGGLFCFDCVSVCDVGNWNIFVWLIFGLFCVSTVFAFAIAKIVLEYGEMKVLVVVLGDGFVFLVVVVAILVAVLV